MILSHIVAAAENGTIGADGNLPWDIPEDMQFFKDKTKGHAIIMGRKTFESLGKPLPNRLNVIVTRQKGYSAPGCTVTASIEEAVEICKKQTDQFGEEIFIIGGGEIYQQSMNFVDRIYLTRIHQKVEGDARYPDVDESVFTLTECKKRNQPVPFSFLTFERKPLSNKSLGTDNA